MSASVSSNPRPIHAGAERLAGLWTTMTTMLEGASVLWRNLATRRGPAEMDARMRRDVGLTPHMVRAEMTKAPWQIEAGLR